MQGQNFDTQNWHFLVIFSHLKTVDKKSNSYVCSETEKYSIFALRAESTAVQQHNGQNNRASVENSLGIQKIWNQT